MQAAKAPRKITPDTPLQYLKGVGEGRAALFASYGFQTAGDLLYFFPFRYEDRRHPIRIADLRKIDAPVALRGKVRSAAAKTSPVKRLRIFEAILEDDSGSVMVVWFNQPYLSEQIRRGDVLSIYGQPRLSAHGRLQFENPDFEKLDESTAAADEGSIVPVYSAISGIPPKAARKIVQQATQAIDHVGDPLPDDLKKRLGVIDLRAALHQLHGPQEIDDDFVAQRSPAHWRIILQEFFAFQLALRLRRAAEETKAKQRGIRIDDAIRGTVRKILPFSLTAAQKRVLKEIADDLQSDRPMYRLLQGDVGSGKTIVALIAAVIAIENGHQTALLAPTEILAEQHVQRIRQLVDHSGLCVAKLTGSTPASQRKILLRDLREGKIDLIIGTHALLEERVKFHSFGLAIVDEQHRFGVAQRQRLFAKGDMPDILVMTATPIPRSLALAMYGDLELSVIDELPPGRKTIKTVVRTTERLEKVFTFIEEQIREKNAQAYVVYPIIDESEKLDLKPLVAGFEEIRASFRHRRIAMLHGRMPAEEKEATMASFKRGAIDILVSTTVIEVGIDVPNASIMVVLDSDRFGLSQLHQLRGRVGRGSAKSYCILIRNEHVPEETRERLALFERTTDGFEVAERDLAARGAGDFFGTRQSGLPRFRFGNILRDFRLMELARDVAIETVARDRAFAMSVAAALIPVEWRGGEKD
ncbi:MAG TPA: ATP-dependent DNA helicase RecG [Thermoanaerobaculia bacterium]